MAHELKYPSHFDKYINLTDRKNLNELLQGQSDEALSFLKTIPEEKRMYQYAEGKWTIKEVLQHLIDSERVFDYRALAFSRKDRNQLPSFDENAYASNTDANGRDWQDLVDEFSSVRKATCYLFKSFSRQQLEEVGQASNYEIDVQSLGYLIAGHFAHHIEILKQRYLV